jgi:hypothetical protein
MNWTVKAIQSLRPGAVFVLRGDELEWLDQKQAEPTAEEIAAEAARLEADEPRRLAQQQRAAAFQQEADPLLFKHLAGEVDKADWLAKREEIRQRFPYPLDAATTTDQEVTS